MVKLRIPLVDLLRPLGLGFAGLTALFGLLTWRLGSLLPKMSYLEQASVPVIQSNSLSGKEMLAEDSLFLPYKIAVYILEKAGFTSLTQLRLASVAFALASAVGMYLVLRRWHTDRIALFTTAIFVTSSWFLFSARLAAPEVCYLLMPWLIYTGIRLQQNNLRFGGLLAIIALVCLMLYVPGLAWLLIPAAVWQRKRLVKELRQTGRIQSGLLLGAATFLLVPLVLSIAHDSSFFMDWLNISGQPGLVDTLKNILGIPVQIFIRSEGDPARHLGHLPYLDIATTVFVALGAYRYIFARKLDRSKFLLAGVAGGIILAGLNIQALAILMPFLYIQAAAGIALLLQQWFTVFPRNPLARNTGVALLAGVLVLVSFYHMQRYFVAWPNTPETKATHSFAPIDRP